MIAGSAGGIPLKTPANDSRPTMDKVRGAIFSSLGEAVIGARVLDLFAGSGGFGIEALSRGAAEAVFVDNNLKSIEAIRFNLEKTKLIANVIRNDVFRYLHSASRPFQLVFADPPYAKAPGDRDLIRDLMSHPALISIVDPSGILVLEKIPSQSEPSFAGWEITRRKRYGGTEVVFCIPSSR